MDFSREQVLRSEIQEVRRMLADLPEEFAIDRLSLRSRLAKLEEELADICAPLNRSCDSDSQLVYSVSSCLPTASDWPSMLPAESYTASDFIGDASLLAGKSTAVFCSSKCPGDIILKATKWIAKLAEDEGTTIVGGFHSAMEKSFLEILLGGRCRLSMRFQGSGRRWMSSRIRSFLHAIPIFLAKVMRWQCGCERATRRRSTNSFCSIRNWRRRPRECWSGGSGWMLKMQSRSQCWA